MLLVYVGTKSLVLCSQVPRQIRQISDESLFVLQQHLSKLTENISGDLKVVLPENDRSSLEEAQGLQIRTLSPCSVVAKKKKKAFGTKLMQGYLQFSSAFFAGCFSSPELFTPSFQVNAVAGLPRWDGSELGLGSVRVVTLLCLGLMGLS